MNSSDSSCPAPSSTPQSISDSDRLLLLLVKESRGLLRSLPESCDASFSRTVESLKAFSATESAGHAQVLSEFEKLLNKSRVSDQTARMLIWYVQNLDKKLDVVIAALAHLQIVESKVDELRSQLAACNE